MAIKTFGDMGPLFSSTYAWGGVPYYANVAMSVAMPENGYVTSITIGVQRYSSSDNPIVWAVIRDRTTGAIIAQSQARTTWHVADIDPYPVEQYAHQFDLPRTFISKDTELWIGFSKVSNQSNRSIAFFYFDAAGYNIDYNDVSQGSPQSIFVPSNNLSNKRLKFMLKYETGGEVKVFDGSANVTKPAKVWNGSQWVQKTVKIFNGSIWKESNS